MKKLTLLLLTALLFFSCKTIEYVPVETIKETIIEVPVKPDGKEFPLTPARIIFHEDETINNYLLINNILEWKIRDLKIKYILKMITAEEYKESFDVNYKAMENINTVISKYIETKGN